MVKTMNKDAMIFAMANPTPEIDPDLAKDAGAVIVGTGRSDYPNQVNNVLGFPQIFRGALDVRATKITEGMKMAASRALAKLAKEPVPDYVKKVHGRGDDMTFGSEYIIPSPFDKRVLPYVATAVAKAAIEDGVATIENFDLDAYKKELEKKFSSLYEFHLSEVSRVLNLFLDKTKLKKDGIWLKINEEKEIEELANEYDF